MFSIKLLLKDKQKTEFVTPFFMVKPHLKGHIFQSN